jgi:hypothetical protein
MIKQRIKEGWWMVSLKRKGYRPLVWFRRSRAEANLVIENWALREGLV